MAARPQWSRPRAGRLGAVCRARGRQRPDGPHRTLAGVCAPPADPERSARDGPADRRRDRAASGQPCRGEPQARTADGGPGAGASASGRAAEWRDEFIEVFQEEAAKLGAINFLVQGTLYPDVIESVSVKGPSAVIKSHHNVGGLPEKMHLKLIEPLRELFKDEVRAVGRELGLPEGLVARQPFPGPGLAVRIVGDVDADRIRLLQESDNIVQEEILRADLYHDLWQVFAVLLPIKSVGVMGDYRTYEQVIAIRAVESTDGMTASWARLPYDVLASISSRIISEVRGVNRVVYDISSKPPSTIEWE